MKIYINILIVSLITNYIHSQDWSMTLIAQDNQQSGASDYIILEMCQECNDGFHFGEDEYDLPTPPDYYTDISFANFEWVGTFDSNGNECTNPEFFRDKRSFHEPVDLLTWNIGGFSNLDNNNALIEFSWNFNQLPDNYEIYIYIGAQGYDMRSQNNLVITQDELSIIYNPETNSFIPNIKILLGGCASAGTTTYYYDEDGDGHGGVNQNPQEFCFGFEPEGWIDNNDDVDDNFYCEENIVDLCDTCNGNNECLDCNNIPWGSASVDDCGICSGGDTEHAANSDMDCAGICYGLAEIDDCGICSGENTNHIENSDMDCTGTCYGSAEIDDCGICNDFNQSCLDELFLNGPQNVNAYINDNLIELSWDQINYPENEAILGFNIYRNGAYLLTTQEEEYLFNEFEGGEFCVSAFDQYNNESGLNCNIATDSQEFCWTLDHGLNLISYPILPLDVSLNNIFLPLNGLVTGVISEGDAASLLPNGIWVGSLTNIENQKGYWVKLDLGDPFASEEYCIIGYPVQNNLEYGLSEGANLISYLGDDEELIINALNQYSTNFTAIIGAAYAAYNSPDIGWVGSLTHLKKGEGYWVIVNENFSFYWIP